MSTFSSSTLESSPQTPAIYKLVVRSAEEAVETIRTKLGEQAKVLSVRQLPGQGLSGLFRRPRLEVIAQIGGDEPVRESAPARTSSVLGTSSEEASPVVAAAPVSLERAPATDRAYAVASADPRMAFRAGANRVETSTRLPELLRRSGFSETMLARLQATPSFSPSGELPLHRALADFSQALRTTTSALPARRLPSRVAFLGTAGSGRTTALCKWLARGVFARSQTGRVIKAEFDRPNPAEGLAVFCEALGLTLDHYVPGDDSSPSIPLAEPSHFTCVDVPALSLRNNAENATLARFLKTEKIDGRVLVLNAVYDLSTLRAAYSMGRDMGATHLVFTHLDELNHWGKLWDFLIDGELTPLFLATGPSLTGDLEEDAIGAVLRKTLPGS
ncbi:MAG: flagellar GTP-binding protein [Opitutaceae bacterium]|nr:flagellar GTP-binding protein [Opitutaceae bacterium]